MRHFMLVLVSFPRSIASNCKYFYMRFNLFLIKLWCILWTSFNYWPLFFTFGIIYLLLLHIDVIVTEQKRNVLRFWISQWEISRRSSNIDHLFLFGVNWRPNFSLRRSYTRKRKKYVSGQFFVVYQTNPEPYVFCRVFCGPISPYVVFSTRATA